MNLAPILVSVYNRKNHLENCINSLKKNEISKKSIIYIVSDNYYKDEHKASIENVRSYIQSITGFKEVRYIFNEQNLGSYWSIKNAIETVLHEHGKIIFLEDDIEVSRFFLKYMNDGLNIFEDNQKIFSICAYSPNKLKIPKNYKKDIYIWSRNSPWGFGTWKNRWDLLDLELHEYDNFIKNRKQIRKFKRIAPMSMSVLKADRENIIQALDVRISFNMFIMNIYSIFPVKSLVRNNGFDGTGEHCEKNNKYLTEEIFSKEIKYCEDIKPDKRIYKARRKWHTSFFRDYFMPIIVKIKPLYIFLKIIKDQIKKFLFKKIGEN